MKIIVTNAHSRIAYRCIKALAEDGHKVIASDFIPFAMSFYSRYANGHFIYPSPYKDQKIFLKHILTFAKQHKVDLIFPIHEETFVFSKYRDEIPPEIKLAVPTYENILSVHNKENLIGTAKGIGIPVPENITIFNESDLDEAVQRIDYPVVLKPRQGGGNYAIRFIHNTENLKEIYLKHLKKNQRSFEQLQIQEYIPPREKYSQVMIFKHGKPLVKFTDRHIRDYPFEGGAGCFRVSATFAEMEEYTEKLLKYLNWHGIAEAEYIISEKDGLPYLIEINPRIWGGVNSAISSGLNVPGLLLKIAFNENIDDSELSYRTGVKTRWLFGDLKTLGIQLKQSENKFLTLFENLNIFSKDITIDEFCMQDPLPFLIHPFSNMMYFIRKRINKDESYYSLKGEWE